MFLSPIVAPVAATLLLVQLSSLTTTVSAFVPSTLSTSSRWEGIQQQQQQPQQQQYKQLYLSTVDDKTEVRDYFNTEGFSRWNKIYSESDDVNTVQLDIRTGHDQTIQKIINWIKNDNEPITGKTVCDCGCGVGSLAIPLASQLGAIVSASDISESMSLEASRRATEMGISNINFYTSDLESVTGSYHTVSCVDVAIHYPDDKMIQMIQHLCSLAEERVIISFAPKTWYYVVLKKIGEFFPGPSKTTRAYLHEESVIRSALEQCGFQITREEMTATNFYFSRLLEAKRTTTTATKQS